MTSAVEKRALDQLARRRQRLQLLLMMLDEWMRGEDAQGMRVNEIRIRTGRDRGGEHLIVVKASFEGRQFVGFHSGNDVEEVLQGALERVKNNTMKWRDDVPFNERDAE